MSPRRNRPKGAGSPGRSAEEDRPGRYGGLQTSARFGGEDWNVRHVAGASARGKAYRCPGCDQTIPDGVPHVVAWPEHGGVDDRRHWHRACWNARDRRTARVRRPGGGPGSR
ncbi:MULTISPECIES: ATP/GTP-binding protein [unclassified Streptomyces]|uniref:ATP/GTP-binding protein n=1 Tax=unclassified Streptomyces TaxID=2593676 RepID=UPI00190881EE|nr:ATP/GTP-binding protein [Streptomyces sp. HSG2]